MRLVISRFQRFLFESDLSWGVAADYFGSKNVGPIYGLMLTAWGCASIAGPGMIAYMRQTTGSYSGALHVIAGVRAISALVPIPRVATRRWSRRLAESN